MPYEKQLTRGLKSRLMYIENKDGHIDGVNARIGWAGFSRTGRTVYYRDLELTKARTASGNFVHFPTGDEYWISGVKKRGSNVHWAEPASVAIDDDALDAYTVLRSG